MVQHRFIYNLNNIRELFSKSLSLISDDCHCFPSTNKQSFKIEYQKMTFFPGNLLQPPPNIKLGSNTEESSHSEQIIQKLYRQNVYLKSQLFSLIQNTPSFDTVNPIQTCIYETKSNTARIFLSPCPQMFSSPQKNRGNIQFLKGRITDRKYLSPNSTPNSRKTEQFYRMKSRSPRNTLDYYTQSIGQQKVRQRQKVINQGHFNDLRTIKSYNASPNKVTPQQSCIFTPSINIERSRSPTLNNRKFKEQQVLLSKVKRYKSPSFLKNRKSYKENIEESMQNVIINTYSQPYKDEQGRESFEKSQILSKEGGLNHIYEQLEKYQMTFEAEQKVNDRKKQGYCDYSEAGSTISIERRLKEILNHPNTA